MKPGSYAAGRRTKLARGQQLGSPKSRTPKRQEVVTLKGFSAFLARGNVIDLAVAVVVGAAFNGVVNAVVKDLLTPLIAALFGKPEFSSMGFTIHNAHFAVGDFINAVVNFVIVALVIYYAIVIPFRSFGAWMAPPVTEPSTCPECLSEIPAGARRCRYCTATLVPAP